jgi:hypothetical protein
VFTVEEREALRTQLVEAGRADPRITGVAITGSASVGKEDALSDIDLAFGVVHGVKIETVLEDFSERMYCDHGAVHHVDVLSGSWIYRVFLLQNTLQVDLAFAPAADFGAKASTFRLVHGSASELPPVLPPKAEELIGWAWLYALHARSSIARDKPWQAEYMISGMRDQVLALACLRHGLSAREGRGMDGLPRDVVAPLQDALVRNLSAEELLSTFRAAMDGLVREISLADEALAIRLEETLRALVDTPS